MAALQTTTTVFIPLQYHTMICTYICLAVLMHPPREFSVFRCHGLKHEAKCTPQLPWRIAHEPQSRPLASWNRKMVKPLLLMCWDVTNGHHVICWYFRSAPKLHLGELPSNSSEQQYSSSNWSCYNTCLNKKDKKRLCRSSGIVWTLKLRHCWMVESFVAMLIIQLHIRVSRHCSWTLIWRSAKPFMRDFDKSFRWGSFTLFIEDFIADCDLLTPDIARELSMVDGDVLMYVHCALAFRLVKHSISQWSI